MSDVVPYDHTQEVEFTPPVDPTRMNNLQLIGQEFIRTELMPAVARFQNNSPRSQQSTRRVLGPSELGGCREYIRASIAGDPKDAPSEKIKMAAAGGTAWGEYLETALRQELFGTTTQERVTCTLPSGITVTGSTDARRGRDRLIDFKSKYGIAEVMRKGPEFKECVQISAYLVANIQKGVMDETALAILVYFDRAGKDKAFWGFTIDYQMAQAYLVMADERLADVTRALATGESQSYLRDQPESWCFHVECPFYSACWGSEAYNPSGDITHPMFLEAMDQYDKARAAKKIIDSLMDASKATLNPDDDNPQLRPTGIGVMPDGRKLRLKFTDKVNSRGEVYGSIDLREVK